MKKIKLVTIAMLMTCVKGYGVVPTECELSVRRGAGSTLLQNINTIKDMTDNQKESFSVTPLKNNHEDIVKGYVGRLDVERKNGAYAITIDANGIKTKYTLALKELEKLTSLNSLIFKSSGLEIF